MRLPVIVLALYAYGLASGADVCPPECKPKEPTCAERVQRLKAHNCPVPTDVQIVDHEVTQPCPVQAPCPGCPACPQAAEKVVKETVVVSPPAVGHWLLGGGPVYLHGVGATAVTGYRWPHHWELLVGPMYVPQNDVPEYDGVARKGCTRIPFTVPAQEAPHPWGAQALVVYAFK